MKLTEIGTPKELFNSPYSSKGYFLFVPDREHYDMLMDQLRKVGDWNIIDLSKLIDREKSIYISLENKGNIEWMPRDSGVEYYESIGYSLLDIEWDDQSSSILSADFCSCSVPALVKSFTGFGGGGEMFNYCRACKKERK